MDSEAYRPRLFAFGMGVRALAVAAIAYLILAVLATQHYATVLVLALMAAFILAEAAHRYGSLMPAVSTGRAQARAEARELDRMSALLDAVTVALVTMRPDGGIRLANRAARLLAGEEVGRLADLKALGPEAAQTIRALPVGARQIVTIADGRPMLVWVGTFTAPDQQPQKLISLQAVTGELDAVQLRAWMDMTRVLSHEIMNSLTPIASLSEGLSRMWTQDGSSPDAADAIAAIGRRSHHLMSFVERYRQIADLPAPALCTVRAAAFVTDMNALIQPALAARAIAYRSAPPPPGLVFQADAALLSQALINLLHNAADAAAAAAHPLVTLACAPQGDSIVFTVTDNGPGIPPERREEIFLPFFTTKSRGAGIGLPLARQIALTHGGHLRVKDGPGGGTSFRLALPMMDRQ